MIAVLAPYRSASCAHVAFARASSVAARHGNPGQADYAMANEVLNKVAALEQRRRGPACVVRAIGWGPWDGGMVDEALRARFRERGVSLIPIDAGARRFVEELASPGPGQAEIVVGGRMRLTAPAQDRRVA